MSLKMDGQCRVLGHLKILSMGSPTNILVSSKDCEYWARSMTYSNHGKTVSLLWGETVHVETNPHGCLKLYEGQPWYKGRHGWTFQHYTKGGEGEYIYNLVTLVTDQATMSQVTICEDNKTGERHAAEEGVQISANKV